MNHEFYYAFPFIYLIANFWHCLCGIISLYSACFALAVCLQLLQHYRCATLGQKARSSCDINVIFSGLKALIISKTYRNKKKFAQLGISNISLINLETRTGNLAGNFNPLSN
jgi:hypothetical protein